MSELLLRWLTTGDWYHQVKSLMHLPLQFRVFSGMAMIRKPQATTSTKSIMALFKLMGGSCWWRLSSFSICLVTVMAAPPSAQADELAQWEKHMGQLQEIRSREPDYGNHYMRIAQAESQLGNTAAVVEHTEWALLQGVHPARVHMLRGKHYLQVMMLDKAMESFQTAVRISPGFNAAWLGMWRSLIQISEDLERRTSMPRKELVSIARELSGRGYHFPITVLDGQKSDSDWVEDARIARERVASGFRFISQENFQRAVAEFQKALEVEFTNAHAFRGLAICHARLGQSERAVSTYTLFVYLADPRDPEVPAVRGLINDYYQLRGAGR